MSDSPGDAPQVPEDDPDAPEGTMGNSDSVSPLVPRDTQRVVRYERYDLTGYWITRWTAAARKKLVGFLRRVVSGGRRVADTELPGTGETVGEKSAGVPGKVAEHFEGRLDKVSIENQLSLAQTEKEFANAELLRQQARKTGAEADRLEIENDEARAAVARERTRQAILAKIQSLIADRSPVIISGLDGEERVIFGNVPLLKYEPEEAPSVADLGLSSRTCRCLESAGIVSVSKLLCLSYTQVSAVGGIGPKSLGEIQSMLAERELRLCDGWPECQE